MNEEWFIKRRKNMSKYKYAYCKHKGIALMLVISAIVVISIIVTGMIFYMRGEVHLTENYVDGVCALLMAEAGVEQALFLLNTCMNNPNDNFYKLVTKNNTGTIEVDTSEIVGKVSGVRELIPGAKVRTQIKWQRNFKAEEDIIKHGVSPDAVRVGELTIISRGTYNNTNRQIEVKKALKAIRVQSIYPGNSIGMVAPNHALYINKVHPDSFKINKFDFWDPWGFKVKNGKIFIREGAVVDLPKWLMITKLRNELEHPWLDMGIGWTGWNGGADFANVDAIEYVNSPVTRQYYKWMGLFHWPWWVKVSNENYSSAVKKVENYSNKDINLYSAEVYRNIANRLVDPEKYPSHGQYFTDVTFYEAYGNQFVSYKNVVPLYGWGDWRNVTNKYHRILGNPTKAHDTSRAVEINGLTYIKGDVLIEGWVKGKGLLVVEGNLYVGGDILTLPDDSGSQSCLGIIVLRDRRFDHSLDNPTSGRIIYKPHHDSDWSRFGITHPLRNITPRWEGCFYAEGGLELDTDSTLKKFINLEIIGNFACDYFDRRKMPNDVIIQYYNWQEVLAQSKYDYTVDKEIKHSEKFEISIDKKIISWREVEVTI